MVRFFNWLKFIFGDHRPSVLDKAMGEELTPKEIVLTEDKEQWNQIMNGQPEIVHYHYVIDEQPKEEAIAPCIAHDSQEENAYMEMIDFKVLNPITLENTRGIKKRIGKNKGERFIAFISFYTPKGETKMKNVQIGTYDTIEEAYYARLKYIVDNIL